MGHIIVLLCIVYVIHLIYRNPRKHRFLRNFRGDFIEVPYGRDFKWDIICILCLLLLLIFFIKL